MTRVLGGLCAVLGFLLLLGSIRAEEATKAKLRGDFEAFFKKLDTNRDGKLSKDEFLQMADRAKEKEKAREKLAQVFEMLDPEHKGISKDQFKRYLDSNNAVGN